MVIRCCCYYYYYYYQEEDELFGRGVLIRVSNLVIPASLEVARFESCALQKCYAMTRIALMCSRVSHAINSRFKWAESMITHMKPFFVHKKK